jgi:hypothetical protein
MAKKIKKADVIEIFGTVKNLAEAVGIVSQGISRWPAVLQDYHINEVISAAWRKWREDYLQKLTAIGVKVDRRINDI